MFPGPWIVLLPYWYILKGSPEWQGVDPFRPDTPMVEQIPEPLRDHHHLVTPANQIFFERDVKASNRAAEHRKLLSETLADRQPVDIHHPKDKRSGATPRQSSQAVEWKERSIAGDDDVRRESGRGAGDSMAILYLLELALEVRVLVKDALDPNSHDIQAWRVAGLTRHVAARCFNHGGIGV